MVGSLYTLINAVNLEASFSKKNDVKAYLVYFGISGEFHKSLFNEFENYLFHKIILKKHPNKSYKLVNLFKLVFRNFQTNKIHVDKLDCIEVFSQNVIFTLLGLFKQTQVCQYHYLEEGLSTYTDYNHKLENRNLWIKIINKYVYNSKLIPKFRSVYIYNQFLYEGVMKTKTLPKFDISLFKSLKNHDIKQNFPERMFLGAHVESMDSLLTKNLAGNEKNIFQLYVSEKLEGVYSILNGENFLYKTHPNEVLNGIHNRFEIYHTNLPWELNINLCEDSNILISVFSTAAITPKILYNKEPRVIFLFRLLQPYLFFQAEEFLVRVRNSYQSKDRVVAPRTIKELSEILSKFCQ